MRTYLIVEKKGSDNVTIKGYDSQEELLDNYRFFSWLGYDCSIKTDREMRGEN